MIEMWDPSMAPIMWGIPWRASSSYATTLNRAGHGNYTKSHAN